MRHPWFSPPSAIASLQFFTFLFISNALFTSLSVCNRANPGLTCTATGPLPKHLPWSA